MVLFLAMVAVLSYFLAGFAFAAALGGTDIQLILSGVSATCGTIAAAGAAILDRLDTVANRLGESEK